MASSRSLCLLTGALLALAVSSARGQWLPDGVPVCVDPGLQDTPIAVSDEMGGAFVSWRDFRNRNGNVFVQHLLMGGAVAQGWSINGVQATTDSSGVGDWWLVASGPQDVIVVWEDIRNLETSGPDLYATRIGPGGTIAPGWPVAGVPVCTAPGYQRRVQCVSDGTGGAFIVWEDFRAGDPLNGLGGDIFALRLDGSGAISPGWPVNGMPVCSCTGDDQIPQVLADGVGGAIVVWHDGSLRAQRLTGAGSPQSGWSDSGIVVTGPDAVPGRFSLTSDGAEGVYVAWHDARTRPPPPSPVTFYLDVYLQHVTASGMIATGWPWNGLPVCTLNQAQLAPTAVSDDEGGVLLAWDDYRSGEGAIYAQRITPSGTLAPGWPADGLLVTTEPGQEAFNRIVGDGLGGAFLAYQNYQVDDRVRVQRVTGAAQIAPGWPEIGQAVAGTPLGQEQPWLVPSATGAIVAWTDLRDYFTTGPDIYAQRFAGDGPVAAQVSLVAARAEPDRVELTWFAASGVGLVGTVYRRTAETDWLAIGEVSGDGTGHLRFVDRAVKPGDRLAYRLGYHSGASKVFTAETWVEISAGPILALEGLRPNPPQAELVAAFSLPGAAPATLELLDLGGRRVLSRDVGALGTGRHMLSLGRTSAIPAGIYWLRLRQAAQVRSARAVVTK